MMERRALLLGATLGIVTATSATAQTDDRAKLLDTLWALEIKSWQDTKDKNIPAMQAYLADPSYLIFYDGERHSRADFLKLLPDFSIGSFNADKSSANVLMIAPDVASLLYRITYTSAAKGAKLEAATVTSANTYVRRDGKWQSALYQETRGFYFDRRYFWANPGQHNHIPYDRLASAFVSSRHVRQRPATPNCSTTTSPA